MVPVRTTVEPAPPPRCISYQATAILLPRSATARSAAEADGDETLTRCSKMWPVVREIASHTWGTDAFGSSYATATVSPHVAIDAADARSPYTMGTGAWNIVPPSIECVQNTPAPSGAIM